MLDSRLAEFAANPIFGVQAVGRHYLPKLAIPDAEVAEAMVGKFEGVAAHFHDLADRHREGSRLGRTPAAFAVRQTVAQLDAWLATPIDQDPMLDVAGPAASVDAARWLERLLAVVAEAGAAGPRALPRRAARRGRAARPARRAVRADAPARRRRGLRARWPRFYTTIDLTPSEIHEIGLQQVAALEDEYRALGPEVVGTSDVRRSSTALRDDPALHHTSGDEIVADSKAAMAKARAAMGDWFGRLPQSPTATSSRRPAARWRSTSAPPQDGSRGGVFFMNVSDPRPGAASRSRPPPTTRASPAITSSSRIAAELDDDAGVPQDRRSSRRTARAGGSTPSGSPTRWGSTPAPLDRIGMLAADSMRACRLVVDTGMHALGWSRQQAIDYLVANSPMRPSHVDARRSTGTPSPPGRRCPT